jgi:hypothetical protein
VVLVTLGGCNLLDSLVVVSIKARKKLVRCSGEGFVRGIVLIPREPRRATLVEHVIELPSLGSWGSCSTQHVGLVWCQLDAEPPSEQPTQQGLACWQTREPRDKNHRVILVFPLVCIPFTQACIYFHIHCACVVALEIS